MSLIRFQESNKTTS